MSAPEKVVPIAASRALMLAELARSGLDASDAEKLGLEPLDRADTKEDQAGGSVALGRCSYRIPYFDLKGERTDFYRLRFTGECTGFHAQVEAGKEQRYNQPGKTPPGVYLPPILDVSWETIAKDTTPIIISEGEKKAAAACKAGFPCIGLGGVGSWQSKKLGLDLLPVLKEFNWRRKVYVIFDADGAKNPQVCLQAVRLAAELALLGAEVFIGFPPAGGPKGIDDVLVAQGVAGLQAVLDAARPLHWGAWPLDLAIPPKRFPHRKQLKAGLGAPIATIEGVQTLLDGYGIEATYNVISKVPIIRGAGLDTSPGAGVQYGAADAALNRIVSQARLCGMPADGITDTVIGIAYGHPVNPVLNWLESLATVQGEDAIQELAHRFLVEEGERALFDATFRLWMIQACAAADYAQQTPNKTARPTFEYVLTLLGAQGACKTSTILSLVPAALREYVGTGIILKPEDKDSVQRATGFWISEIGEIDGTFGKSAAATLKAFLSQRMDVYRRPYARERNSWPRQTVYAATGNIERSLRDVTGSRRFWPVNVQRADPPDPALVERAWVQAWRLYLDGEQWWPPDDLQKRLDGHVLNYAEEFPLGEAVISVFGPLTPEAKKERGTVALSASRIMEEVAKRTDMRIHDRSDQRFQTASRELGLWLARANLDASGRPDRRQRAGTSEWHMPKLPDRPGAKF